MKKKPKAYHPDFGKLDASVISSTEVIKSWIDLQDSINTYLDPLLASRAENE